MNISRRRRNVCHREKAALAFDFKKLFVSARSAYFCSIL